jgi:enoyl reductase-like protein
LSGLSSEAERKFIVRLAESAQSYLGCAVKSTETELMTVYVELLLTSIEESTSDWSWKCNVGEAEEVRI